MNPRIVCGGLVIASLIGVLIGGCQIGRVVYSDRLEAMRAEIEALAADKTASDDSDCGFTRYVEGEGTCSTVDLVYSRATVDEDLLLEKVQEYNEFVQFVNRAEGFDRLMFPVCAVEPLPVDVKVVAGVCVASY